MTVLVMFLEKAFHCLLLRSAILGARSIVVRSEVCFGELGALWRASTSPLIMGTGHELRGAYGMLVFVAEAKRGKQYLARVGLEVLGQLFTWKKGGVEDPD